MRSLAGKTVLVTGATGFIGKHLVDRLRNEKGICLILLSRKATPLASDEIWIHSPLEKLSFQTWQRVGINQIDLVFHLAAFTPRSKEEADFISEVFQHNLQGTKTLLESFPNIPEKIVFTSSLDVYAPPKPETVLNESSPLGPISLYGASKLFCEKLIAVYAKMSGCSHAILRLGHIYGPGEEAYSKLIPELIRQILNGEAPVLYGNGSTQRDFLYVIDAVEAIMRAASSDKLELGPLNIVSGSPITIRQIAEELIRIIGFSGRISFVPDKSPGHSLRFDNQMMRDILGEWRLIPITQGLEREVEYFRRVIDER